MGKTRDEVEDIVIGMYTRNGPYHECELEEDVNRIMSLAPLRLAEKAEQNKSWRLAVVDTSKCIGFQEEADYSLVIEVSE